MSTNVIHPAPVAAKPATKPGRRLKQPGGASLGQDATREARRLAAAILEVLAGARTPAEAATVLALSLPRYYQVESRALQGLLQGCEARPKGRTPSLEGELAALRRQNERLQRDVMRQQALVRAAQRTMGLPPPQAAPLAKSGKKTRPRRRARALSVAARLQAGQAGHDASLPAVESANPAGQADEAKG